MKINYFLSIILSISIFACTSKKVETVQEDYEALFPWQGIDKPENAYEDMNVRICNPDESLTQYRYLGVSLPNAREYIVTISCLFNESTEPLHSPAKYYVRFIDDKKQITTIGTNATDDELKHTLRSGEPFTQSFTVRSGYPMYLLINGIGHRGSKIKASISATSKDGLIVVPILSSDQSQNKEGPNKLNKPYCEYIILP